MSDSRTWAEDQDNEGVRKMRPGDGWDLAIKDGSIAKTSIDKYHDEYFAASDAQKLTEKARSVDGDYLHRETLEIFNLISIGAKAGQSSITIDRLLLDPVIKRRLEKLNYVVTVRDTEYITIKWM